MNSRPRQRFAPAAAAGRGGKGELLLALKSRQRHGSMVAFIPRFMLKFHGILSMCSRKRPSVVTHGVIIARLHVMGQEHEQEAVDAGPA
jgi:hypothetical protein